MPHFICRWPGGDVLLASVESRQELDAILQVWRRSHEVARPAAAPWRPLTHAAGAHAACASRAAACAACVQERCEPGVCKVARYHGPLVLELKPNVPGVPRASAERFAPTQPACPVFQAAWGTRVATADAELLAADCSRQLVHKLVLQCRLPVLQGQPVPAGALQVSAAHALQACSPSPPRPQTNAVLLMHHAASAACPAHARRCGSAVCQTQRACRAWCTSCTWTPSAARTASRQRCMLRRCAAACSGSCSCARHTLPRSSSCSLSAGQVRHAHRCVRSLPSAA
jgi:hypothetical protein